MYCAAAVTAALIQTPCSRVVLWSYNLSSEVLLTTIKVCKHRLHLALCYTLNCKIRYFLKERYSYNKNYKILLFSATMSISTHTSFLERHCRVCCKVLGKQNHRCSQHDSLLRSLGVDVSSDKAEVHPEFFCIYCYLAAKKCCNQSSQTPSRLIEWLPHNDTHCNICDVRCKGGRPKKCSSRPSLISTHIKSVALPVPSFTLAQVLDHM